MINKQAHCLERDNISEKQDFLHVLGKSLVSGAIILEIIFIADYQAHAALLQML